MEKLTGRDYMVSAIKRMYADRVPVTIIIGPYCAKSAGYTIREILTDAKKGADAHLAFFNRFRPDSVSVYNDIYLEFEAIGGKLEFFDDRISHPKAPLLEKPSDLIRLKLPDPKKDGRIPYLLEMCKRVAEDIKNEATVGLGHSGPWNLANHLRGTEQLLMDDITDPAFMHDLMTYATEVVKIIGDAIIAEGFAPSIGEATSSCSLISPKIYRQFIKPFHKILFDYFLTKKAYLSIHICGYIDPIMADILETGINFISLDSPSSMQKLLEQQDRKAIIMGNVATGLFANGSQSDMEDAIKNCINTAADKSGYILCSGCEIPLNSTEDRIEHYFSYGRKYGRQFMAAKK
jgi:uroporphyrinogen decarboxylase